MGKMIYAILDKNNGTIYFSDTKRTEEELETTELLYTSDTLTLDDIKRDLRPWICLGSSHYKNTPEIKEYLKSGNIHEFYTRIYPNEIKSELERFNKDYMFLYSLGCVSSAFKPYNIDDLSNLIYDCDIYNYLTELYGKTNVDTVYEYRSLGKDEKNFLEIFTQQGTKDKKLQWIEKNLDNINQETLNFLPEWYRLSLRTVGNKKQINTLEYKNPNAIGGNDEVDSKKIKDMFFSTFKLGETYTGQEIKEKIQEIYITLGITKTPKISDLVEFFEITNVSMKSSYRIDLRK